MCHVSIQGERTKRAAGSAGTIESPPRHSGRSELGAQQADQPLDQTRWRRRLRNDDGSLDPNRLCRILEKLHGDVAKPYHEAMTKAGGTIGTSLAMKDFMTACEADTFKGMQ